MFIVKIHIQTYLISFHFSLFNQKPIPFDKKQQKHFLVKMNEIEKKVFYLENRNNYYTK